MTFTMQVKDEISKIEPNSIDALTEISAFIRFDGTISKEEILLTMENASVARRIYKLLKTLFNVKPNIMVRVQKRFRVKQIYMLSIKENVDCILEKLNIYKNKRKVLPEEFFLDSEEEVIAFLRGLFLATGSISNPQTTGYHLEFSIHTKMEAMYVVRILKKVNVVSKILKRKTSYMVYVKSADMISDLLKMFNATNSMFFFEDIRIYRDHKNMVNRLNNCEIANQEKTIQTGLKQLEDIKYLQSHDLIPLLDERIQEVISYRLKYPETSYQELADIVSQETGKPVGKSGINHYFRKIKELVKKNQDKEIQKKV